MSETDVYPGPRIERYHHLGGGMVRPFVRTFHRDFANTQGVDLVLSNIGQVLGTKIGTLPWRPDFGSQLEGLRHKANTVATRELAGFYVREALSRWEPRAQLRRLTIDAPAKPGVDDNQIVLHPVVSIEGMDEVRQLVAALARRSEGSGIDDDTLLAYNLTQTARVSRGFVTVVPAKVSSVTPTTSWSTGLMRPIVRARDFSHGSGIEEILSNVGEVLGTAPGTLPWLPEFGCEIHRLRHRANTPALRELARLYVEKALTKWEPRAQVTKVELLPLKGAENSITIRVLCRIALLREGQDHTFDVAIK